MQSTNNLSTAWVQVRYLLEKQRMPFDDQFNLRVVDEMNTLSPSEKIAMMEAAIETFLKRFPEFEPQIAHHVPAFLKETQGNGVIWFSRKNPNKSA